jgi:hypothetical protein
LVIWRPIAHCIPFLAEVKDMTAGTAVERWLNQKYAELMRYRLFGTHARVRQASPLPRA